MLLDRALHLCIRTDGQKSFSFSAHKRGVLNKIAEAAVFLPRCRAIRMSFRPEQCPSTVIVSLPFRLQFSYQGRGTHCQITSPGK